MKYFVSIPVILIILTSITSCFPGKKNTSQPMSVHPLTDTTGMKEGTIVYALPRTVFTVVAEAERVVEKPGPYALYAADYIGIEDAILSETEKWSVIGVRIIQHQEVDPSEYYVIESGSIIEINVLALKKEGLILDLNPDSFKPAINDVSVIPEGIALQRSFDRGSDEYYQLQRDTAYRRVNVDSSFVRIPYIIEKKKKLTTEQLAERAAKRLMEMREGKHLILTGEATVFPQDEAPLREMNRLEKEYTDLFVGKVFKERRFFTYQIIPDKEKDTKPATIFYFSQKSGPSEKPSANSIPVTAEFIPENKTKDITIISHSIADPVTPSWDKLFYRVPDVVNIKILKGNEVLLNSRRMVYQYGTIIQLPANYIIGK